MGRKKIEYQVIPESEYTLGMFCSIIYNKKRYPAISLGLYSDKYNNFQHSFILFKQTKKKIAYNYYFPWITVYSSSYTAYEPIKKIGYSSFKLYDGLFASRRKYQDSYIRKAETYQSLLPRLEFVWKNFKNILNNAILMDRSSNSYYTDDRWAVLPCNHCWFSFGSPSNIRVKFSTGKWTNSFYLPVIKEEGKTSLKKEILSRVVSFRENFKNFWRMFPNLKENRLYNSTYTFEKDQEEKKVEAFINFYISKTSHPKIKKYVSIFHAITLAPFKKLLKKPYMEPYYYPVILQMYPADVYKYMQELNYIRDLIYKFHDSNATNKNYYRGLKKSTNPSVDDLLSL